MILYLMTYKSGKSATKCLNAYNHARHHNVFRGRLPSKKWLLQVHR